MFRFTNHLSDIPAIQAFLFPQLRNNDGTLDNDKRYTLVASTECLVIKRNSHFAISREDISHIQESLRKIGFVIKKDYTLNETEDKFTFTVTFLTHATQEIIKKWQAHKSKNLIDEKKALAGNINLVQWVALCAMLQSTRIMPTLMKTESKVITPPKSLTPPDAAAKLKDHEKKSDVKQIGVNIINGKILEIVGLAKGNFLICFELGNNGVGWHVFNRMRAQMGDIAVNAKWLAHNCSAQSLHIALPEGGFLTLLRENLFIWINENNHILKPLSYLGLSISIRNILNIFFQPENNRVFFNVDIDIADNDISTSKNVLIAINLHDLNFTIIPATTELVDENSSPLIRADRLHIFPNNQWVGITSRPYNGYNLSWGYRGSDGNLVEMGCLVNNTNYRDRSFIVSPDYQFIAVGELDSRNKKYALRVYQTKNGNTWQEFGWWALDQINLIGITDITFLGGNRLVYSANFDSGNSVLKTIDFNHPTAQSTLLLPRLASEIGKRRTEYLVDDYVVRVEQKDDNSKTNMSWYSLYEWNAEAVKPIIAEFVAKEIASLIWEYARPHMFYKPEVLPQSDPKDGTEKSASISASAEGGVRNTKK